MSYWDDVDTDPDDGRDDWQRETITLVEPFAGRFGMTSARRYDVLAHLERALRLPRRDFAWSTEKILAHLYNIVSDAWRAGVKKADRDHARGYLRTTLLNVDSADVRQMVDDFGWSDNLRVTTTPAQFDDEVKKAVARRMAPNLERLLRSFVSARSDAA